MSSLLMNIEKLEGSENYSTWKFAMKMLLIHEELWECVENENVDIEKEKKALAMIGLAVQPSVIPYIRTAKTAYEAWNNLKNTYESRGLCRKVGLLRSLRETKLQDFGSMENYLSKIKELSNQLSDIEFAVDDGFLCVFMLNGLTKEYAWLVKALENSDEELSSDFISVKLMEEAKRLENQQKPENQIKCFKCKRNGHYAKNCPDKRVTGQSATDKVIEL